MQMLSRQKFREAGKFVREQAREVDRALFSFYYEGAPAHQVWQELTRYQNEDGGFGHGLEPDFAWEGSSPMATTVGLQYLREAGAPADLEMVRRAIDYLLRTLDPVEQRWHAVPPEVNDAPHAPWWHYSHRDQGCLIDQDPANPAAEIVSCFHMYRELVPPELLISLTGAYVDRLLAQTGETGMHATLCYVKMVEMLTGPARERCMRKLEELVKAAVVLDPDRWGEYGASPLFFAGKPDSPLVRLFPAEVELNLDYLIKTQETDGSWKPNWNWGQYEEAWREASRKWAGHLTVKNLKILSDYGRVEAE